MPIPSLPLERTEGIILLAVRDLVEQERRQPDPSPSPTNAFLLSASLVSSTWRSIAQPALLRHGLVTPSGVNGFLEQLDTRGMAATVASVRFGPGGRRAGVQGRDDGDALLELEDRLPALAKLEFIGVGLVFSRSPCAVRRRVPHVLLTNQKIRVASKLFTHFSSNPPSRLTIFDILRDTTPLTRDLRVSAPNWKA